MPVDSVKVTPEGSGPVLDSVGVGHPVATTVNAPLTPTVKVALEALVMAGATGGGLTVTEMLEVPS